MNTERLSACLPIGLNRIFYGWWIVWSGFFITLYVGSIILYGFTAFFEPLVKEFGWSYAQISFASSLRGLEMSLLSPIVGFLAHRFGGRTMIFWGVFTIGAGLFLLSFTNSLWMFYASFILIGFGGGGCTTVVLTGVVANWFQRDIGKAVGILASGFGASGLMVPLIVCIIDSVGWRLALMILGAGMWAIGIPLTRLIRNTPEACGLVPDGRPVILPTSQKSDEASAQSVEVPFTDALWDRIFVMLFITELIRFMSLSAVVTHIMPYLGLVNISRVTAGLVAGAIPVWSIAGRFGFGWLADRYNKKILIATSYTLMSLGLIFLCFVDTAWTLVPFLFLFSSGFGGAMVVRVAIIREEYGRAAFGRLFGIILGAAGVGGVIGPTLTGLIYDTSHNYLYAWVGLTAATAFSAFLMFIVIRRKSAF